VQDVAVAVGGRVGHGDAALRQVLHQVQVKRQLLKRQPLEQREHELALGGGGEIVGVLDAALNAAQFAQLAEFQFAQQGLRLFGGDFSENSHGRFAGSEFQDVPDARAIAAHLVFGHAGLGLHGDALRLAAVTQLVHAATGVFNAHALDALAVPAGGLRVPLERGGRGARGSGPGPAQRRSPQGRIDKGGLAWPPL
jgi:hypothetical protein